MSPRRSTNSPDIIYEDEALIVCRKPAGIATQTGRLGQRDMQSILSAYRAKRGEEPQIAVVHRLDQPVEGVMVFAKNRQAAAALSEQIRTRQIGKHYYAVVLAGDPDSIPAEGTLSDSIEWDAKSNLSRIVEPPDRVGISSPKKKEKSKGKRAVLDYRVVMRKEHRVLVDITLGTGRHHQIRVQFAHIGCPIVGDRKYGAAKQQDTLALCSYRLEFCHPVSGAEMEFSIEPENPVLRQMLDTVNINEL